MKTIAKTLAKRELARREFFSFCQLKAPDFYKPERKYLVDLCSQLQDFYYSDDYVLVINLPPRTGKTRTVSYLVEWILGLNVKEKIMTGSYNEMLSTTFSKNVRNDIQEVKADAEKTVYSDVFPGVKIKDGDGAMNLWSLEGGYNSYLATSPNGTATGFGCKLMVIDDLIKNAEEAYNETVKSKHWDWFTNTMLSRLEEGGKIIIVMTRWASDDLAGKVLEHYKNEKVRHISIKALQDDGTMLCEEILSYNSYQSKIRAMGADIASANYQQEPIDLKGRLYSSLKTYDDVPRDKDGSPLFRAIKNYTDTADMGSDYLCSINYGVTMAGEAYLLDVCYTKEPNEITEGLVAKMLVDGNVNETNIESNNGGRAFARSVERIMKDLHSSNRTKVSWFHQSKNKQARILSNAPWVMEHIYFPSNWRDRWPDFHDAVIKYQREGKNTNDDAPDVLTGIAEKCGVGKRFSF